MASPGHQLKLITPSGYVANLAALVRVEVTDAAGQRDWGMWDAEATLSSDPPRVTLSTNRVVLRNGLGSALVSCSNGADFDLIVTLGDLQTHRFLRLLTNVPVVAVGGILPGLSTTWSGLVRITNDVIVPAGHTLTLQPDTLVLIEGVTNGTVANDISVSGTIRSLGTAVQPVTITCAEPDLAYRWGQIRHNNAQPSLYRYTSITRGGRSTGEGHTGTAPVIRPIGSTIRFESCNITDHAESSPASVEFGKPGKIMQASLGSDITFDDCLLARSRMGPEINGTALLLTNSYIVEMYGVNDSDGIFLDAQQPGQSITLTRSVIAEGDDDGIDTLGSTFTVDHCIIRNWRNPFEDSKGISVEGGEARIWHSLLVDNALGVSGKGNNGVNVRVRIDHSTILSESYAVGATNKTGTTPVIDYRITNSILRGTSISIFTQYNPSDIHIDYSNAGQFWVGQGNLSSDPMFMNVAGHDYRLQLASPCIDSGDPAAPLDPDGSRTDMGSFTFLPPPPVLRNPRLLSDGSFRFELEAYPNRSYLVEVSTNPPIWNPLGTVFQASNVVELGETNGIDDGMRLYRARLAP